MVLKYKLLICIELSARIISVHKRFQGSEIVRSRGELEVKLMTIVNLWKVPLVTSVNMDI